MSTEAHFAQERQSMLRAIEMDVRATRRYTGKSNLDPRVMSALGRVPRHEFVPSELHRHAYENRPLAIGEGQTISQPYIVALMTDLLALEPGDKVLEIGTGSGYQAAVLAELEVEVHSIEIVPSLARKAHEVLTRLGYERLHLRVGDGYQGWSEEAPFDAIIVTASPDHVPPPLLDQLAVDGRLVIPLRQENGDERLTVIVKQADGSVERREILPVRFVPFTGQALD